MQKIIIKPQNACAAAEFVFAVNPFWLRDLDMNEIHFRRPEWLFLDAITGETIKVEINVDPKRVYLRYAEGPILHHEGEMKITWWEDAVTIVRRMYPLTSTFAERAGIDKKRKQIVKFELELPLDGIWATWEDAQRPDCPSFDDRACTCAPQICGRYSPKETVHMVVAQSMEPPLTPEADNVQD